MSSHVGRLTPKQRAALEQILLAGGPTYAHVLANMQSGATAYSSHPALQAFYETLLLGVPLDPLTTFVQERRPWPRWSTDPSSNLRRLTPRDVMGMTAWTLVCPENADRAFAYPTLCSLARVIAYEVLESSDALVDKPTTSPGDFRTAWDLAYYYCCLEKSDYVALTWTRQAMVTAAGGLPPVMPTPPPVIVPHPTPASTELPIVDTLRTLGQHLLNSFGRRD